jgi:hypothetical protein
VSFASGCSLRMMILMGSHRLKLRNNGVYRSFLKALRAYVESRPPRCTISVYMSIVSRKMMIWSARPNDGESINLRINISARSSTVRNKNFE